MTILKRHTLLFFNANLGLLLLGIYTIQVAWGQTGNIKHYTVQIEANSSDWVYPGNITLKKGDFVLFNASGRVTLGKSYFAQNAPPTGINNLIYGIYNRSLKYAHGSVLVKNGNNLIGTYSWDQKKYKELQDKRGRINSVSIPAKVMTVVNEQTFAGNYFISDTAQRLGFILNDKQYQDNAGKFFVEVYVVSSKCPDIGPSFDLAKYADAKNGIVDFSINNDALIRYYKNQTNNGGLWFEDITLDGHSYLAINPLGTYNSTPLSAADILKQNIGSVFPGGAKDKTDPNSSKPEVKLNHTYSLGALGFEVTATDVSTYHFTFTTGSYHPLNGTAKHGVFKDADGNLFMFQQGRGVSGEAKWQQEANLFLAPDMWQEMAGNMKALLP